MKITDEQVEAWARGFRAAGIDLDNLEKVIREIAETVIFACMEFEKAMEQVTNITRAGLVAAANELEELEAVRKEAAPLKLPTARDRKAAREKQRAVERAAVSWFCQYTARESAWAARKMNDPRRREWRGPWKEN